MLSRNLERLSAPRTSRTSPHDDWESRGECMALVERLHWQGGDWRAALFTHAGLAIDELSLSPGSGADAGHNESTAGALLCRLD